MGGQWEFGFAIKDNLLVLNLTISLFKHIMEASFVSDTSICLYETAEWNRQYLNMQFGETLKGHIMCQMTVRFSGAAVLWRCLATPLIHQAC